MFLKEPKAEFVPIDLRIAAQVASPSVCKDSESHKVAGGGQRCIASQIDAHYCDTWADDVPWLD